MKARPELSVALGNVTAAVIGALGQGSTIAQIQHAAQRGIDICAWEQVQRDRQVAGQQNSSGRQR